MNRYAVAGIAADVAAGRRVLLLAATLDHGRRAFRQVEERFVDAGAMIDVKRSNGQERIQTVNGGLLLIGSVRAESSWRGRTADVLVVEDYGWNPVDLERMLPVIAASPDGELVRL